MSVCALDSNGRVIVCNQATASASLRQSAHSLTQAMMQLLFPAAAHGEASELVGFDIADALQCSTEDCGRLSTVLATEDRLLRRAVSTGAGRLLGRQSSLYTAGRPRTAA